MKTNQRIRRAVVVGEDEENRPKPLENVSYIPKSYRTLCETPNIPSIFHPVAIYQHIWYFSWQIFL